MQGLPQIGEVLDDTYRIESLLGQGGFGAVYLARQLSMDRQVAIKVLVAHASWPPAKWLIELKSNHSRFTDDFERCLIAELTPFRSGHLEIQFDRL